MARKVCSPCGRTFEAKHPSAKYCSGQCRTKAYRNKGTAEVVELPGAKKAAPARPALADTVRAELEKAKRIETALGLHVLMLAERLDRATNETGAALAALDRAFRAAYAEALENAETEADELDDLRERANQAVRLVSG